MSKVVRIQSKNECYLASWEGDPGRTLIKRNAIIFDNNKEAETAISEAKKTHPFQKRVYKIENYVNS